MEEGSQKVGSCFFLAIKSSGVWQEQMVALGYMMKNKIVYIIYFFLVNSQVVNRLKQTRLRCGILERRPKPSSHCYSFLYPSALGTQSQGLVVDISTLRWFFT